MSNLVEDVIVLWLNYFEVFDLFSFFEMFLVAIGEF